MVTYEASSGYHSDIQDAIDLASSGDTVLIPAGTHNFIDADEVWGYDITSQEKVNVPPGIHVKGVTTPTQILHGEQDIRVPISQGYELYNALKRQGCTTEMVVYPRTAHGPSEPKFIVDIGNRIIAWFNGHLGRK